MSAISNFFQTSYNATSPMCNLADGGQDQGLIEQVVDLASSYLPYIGGIVGIHIVNIAAKMKRARLGVESIKTGWRGYTVKRPDRSYKMNPTSCKKWVLAHSKPMRPIAQKFIDNVKHVSQKEFEERLKASVEDFNAYLDTLPASERKFLVVIPGDFQKSNTWVTMLAKQSFKYQPCDIIMYSDKDFKEKTNDPLLKHIVSFDDGAYSGSQFSEENGTLDLMTNRNVTFHAIIPFMTQLGKKRIEQSFKRSNQPYRLATHEIMTPFVNHLSIEEVQLLQSVGSNLEILDSFLESRTQIYFDHKVADGVSQFTCMRDGRTLDGRRKVPFIPRIYPPYKPFAFLTGKW